MPSRQQPTGRPPGARGSDAAVAVLPDEFGLVRAAIAIHGQELASYPGVLSVRPGYRIRTGQITDEPAITVGVVARKELAELAARDLIPRRLGRVIVDVVALGVEEQLRIASSQAGRSPALTGAAATTSEGLAAGTGIVDLRTLLQVQTAEAFDLDAMAPLEDFPEPSRTPEVVDEDMTLTLHASPDAGWRVFRAFLNGTERRLTATMFEFTATHILETLIHVLPSPRTFEFIMDFERDNPEDLDNPRALQRLGARLGDRLTFAWAPVGADRVTTVGYFPSSYHIKVVVRDGSAVWLSSGNWKESSQPEVDPLNPPQAFDAGKFRRDHNREWHVVAESPSLAEQFEFFIRHDIAVALPVQAADLADDIGRERPDLFIPVVTPSAVPQPFFEERVFKKRMRVRPLLTPRHFVEHVLPLLASAKERVWFQNQSLKPSAANAEYMELFNALRDASRKDSLDTRIIVRGDFGPAEIQQTLRQSQFRMSRVRLQRGCHTKGLIIDNTAVIVGSHNWTGQGTTQNRDASLIIEDHEAIDYFAQLFEQDWDNFATIRNELTEFVGMLAPPGVPAPEGMRRVSWRELVEE